MVEGALCGDTSMLRINPKNLAFVLNTSSGVDFVIPGIENETAEF